MEFLQDLLYGILVAVAPILTGFVCKWLADKSAELKQEIKIDAFNNTINTIEMIISDAVRSTTQTYVDSLKAKNMFDKEAQLEAFHKTKDVIMMQLTDNAKNIIASIYGDVNTYINTQIEAKVKEQK